MRNFLAYKILRVIYHWSIDYFLSPFKDLARRIRIEASGHFWEKRLRIKTDGNSPIQNDATFFKDSAYYMPTPYHVIEGMLGQLQFGPDDVFVDLGCGKGRVVLAVAEKKLKKVIGIEARKDMFDIAMENLKKVKINNTPVEIVNADVVTFDMREGTIFFMFNPFGMNTQKRVMENIRDSLSVNPRQVRVICYAAPDISRIDGCDKWLVQEKRLPGINVDIWRSKI